MYRKTSGYNNYSCDVYVLGHLPFFLVAFVSKFVVTDN